MAMPRPEKPVPTIATSCSMRILLLPFLEQVAVVEIPGMEPGLEILEVDRRHLAQRARADEVELGERPPLARRPQHAVSAHQPYLMIEHQRPEDHRRNDHRGSAIAVAGADFSIDVEG